MADWGHISVADVQAGDVLLFHGTGFVSWAIRKIDGSEVNHAAIALPGGWLAEVGGMGLEPRRLPTTFSDDDYMLVRRHPSTDPLEPVLEKAQAYLANGAFYAYQQIVLLAALGVTRQIPARGFARLWLRAALDHAARALMDLLPIGASWMICSEYVYRCFDEASDAEPDPWRIEIGEVEVGEAALNEGSWLDWAEERAADTLIMPAASFALAAHGPEATEAELAPLIAEWAAHAPVDESDPLPVGRSEEMPGALLTDESGAEAAMANQVSDEEMLSSMVQFSEALKVARSSAPGVSVEFGVIPGVITEAAVTAALQGLRDLTVDPNFVTPRDLLHATPFGPPERAE